MRGKWFGFGCLTSVILLIIILVLVFTGMNSYMNKYRGEKKKIAEDTWLVLNLENEIKEYSEISQDFWGKQQNSAHNYIQAINQAAKDDMIKGIILCPRYFAAGYSTLNSLMNALRDFRASGKPVYAYLNMATNRGYYLASVADKVYLNPSASAGILLSGVGGHILYYEKLLEKLGVDMQVIHAGKYKAAGEQFVRNEMSPEFRENLTALYKDIYQEMMTTIAANRGMEIQELRNLYEKRDNIWINGEYSIKSGLVDELMQYEELMAANSIGKKNKIPLSNYPLKPSFAKNNKIAVLYAQGNITAQAEPAIDMITSAKMVKLIKEIEENPKIKAVVMRVNSPGGSALESDIILNSINDLQRSKPFIVSMGDVAASGGYYISCSADQVFADPMTITGSIGVVSMFPNLNKMGDKIGVSSSRIKYGRYSDILNPWEKPDPSEMAALKNSMLEIYDEFKNHVAQGRDKTLNEVEEIAQGKVWSSKQALKIGLIDQVGDLNQALSAAADAADISSYEVAYYPKQKSLMDLILKEYFDIEMAAQLFSGKIDYLYLLEELQIIESIKESPHQAYCPVVLD